MSHFRVRGPEVAPDQVLREAAKKERDMQKHKQPMDVSNFLSPVGVWELKHVRKMSSLTALTYWMNLITPRRLERMHGLHLVTTSRTCDIRSFEHTPTAEEVGDEGDGMAVSFQEAKDVYKGIKRKGKQLAAELASPPAPSAAAGSGNGGSSSNVFVLGADVPFSVPSAGPASQGGAKGTGAPGAVTGEAAGGSGSAPGLPSLPLPSLPAAAPIGRMLWSPAELVAAKLTEAAALAAATATPLASAAESLAAGLAASLPIGAPMGANNKASNALLPGAPAGLLGGVSQGKAPEASAGPSAPASSSAAAASEGVQGGFGSGASAAGIAALAAQELRQKASKGLRLGGVPASPAAGRSGSPGSAGAPSSLGAGAAPALRSSSPGGSRSGAGMAPVSSSGLLAPPAPNTALVPAGAAGGAPALTFASAPSSLCPSEWFIVDDPATDTRYFVIQGSDTLDHWRLNLTFDPVPFEDPCLGLKVHRGVYEAAQVLYDRFLPWVYEHLESSPFSKISFTGHSIGGSMAMLLMLMYRIRGVLPPHSIATVYTFGAPSVFCQQGAAAASRQAAAAGVACSLDSLASCSMDGVTGAGASTSSMEDLALAGPGHVHGPGCGCGASTPLLARLGLPQHIVRNVIMARDIVPRAFACDYSLVADILKSWGAGFKEHCCLNRQGRKHLYYFVGRMYILQPDTWHTFVGSDPEHPMLPPGAGLYSLAEPHPSDPPAEPSLSLSNLTHTLSAAASGAAHAAGVAHSAAAAAPHAAAGAAAAAASVVSTAASAAAGGLAAAVRPRREPRDVVEAVEELMDNPHPLETLADAGAYMSTGSISRYHNPEHYTKALGRVIFHRRRQEGAVLRPRAGQFSAGAGAAARSRQAAGGGSSRGGVGSGMPATWEAAAVGGPAVEAEAEDEPGCAAASWDSSDQLEHVCVNSLMAADAHVHH